MKKNLFAAIKLIFVFVITIAVMTLLLVAVAMIPKDAIRNNVLESAKYLSEREPYPLMMEKNDGSRIDYYCDSILLNIIYSQDSSAPLLSVMKSGYYYKDDLYENLNLLEAVTDDKAPNIEYLRYWHGSVVPVKPLLLIIPIQKIYMVTGAFIILLTAWFCIAAKRSGNTVLIPAMLISLVMVRIWYIPFCFEYTWIFIIMPAASIIAMKIAEKNGFDKTLLFFMLTGMITNYIDFLTNETLTLLIPLLVTVYVMKKHGDKISNIVRTALASSAVWLFGYAVTWMTKWLLASIVLGENVMPYVSGHIAHRIGGDLGMGLAEYLFGAVIFNIACLFPLRHSFLSMLGFGLIILTGVYFGYVHKRADFDKKIIAVYAAAGAVPIGRYMLLHNHAYKHYFFTYRALAATVFAIVLVIGEITGGIGNTRQEAEK